MPTYEYECDACGHTFEKFQSMKARPVRTCPECGKRSVRRLLGTGAALIFKGSGFYATDYRSESYKRDEKKANGAKTDTKTDAKAKPTCGAKADASCTGCRKKAGTCPNDA